MSALQVQAEWAAIVEIVLLLVWAIVIGITSKTVYGLVHDPKLEAGLYSSVLVVSSFVIKIVIISIHFFLAIFLYASAKQRNSSRLRLWFIIRLIFGILLVAFIVVDIFHLLSVFGFDLYTVFLLSLYLSWTCFIIYSLFIVHLLIKEIQYDYIIARNMYRLYSGRNPY